MTGHVLRNCHVFCMNVKKSPILRFKMLKEGNSYDGRSLHDLGILLGGKDL